jgi:hypothetical protein
MGSKGNYQVVGRYESSGVLKDDDKPADIITLAHVAGVPEVDGATLDLSCFKAHLDHAKQAHTHLYWPHTHNRAKCPNHLSPEESIPRATR